MRLTEKSRDDILRTNEVVIQVGCNTKSSKGRSREYGKTGC